MMMCNIGRWLCVSSVLKISFLQMKTSTALFVSSAGAATATTDITLP